MTSEDVRPVFLADTATGLPIPADKTFATVTEHRRHVKQRLAAALRLFGREGFGEGISGHISVRDPQYTDQFWVNPFGVSFNRVTVADLIRVDLEGRVVAGSRKVNPSAFVIHAAIHQQYPDLHAIAHAHTPYSRALGSLGGCWSPSTRNPPPSTAARPCTRRTRVPRSPWSRAATSPPTSGTTAPWCCVTTA